MERIKRTTRAIAILLGIAVGLAACSKQQEQPAEPDFSLQLNGAGATFPEPLYQQWAKLYHSQHPDVSIHYEGVGSGEGIKRFIAEQVDFGASDSAMNDAEIAQVKRGVSLIPTAAGMVVLAYNLPGLGSELRLSRAAVAGIFLGKIKRWDDIEILKTNPGLPLPPNHIQPVVRLDSSGTTYAFTSHLSAISKAWRESGPGTGKQVGWPGGALTGSGNEGVAQKINISQYSIGYLEYGFAQRLGLPMATLENKFGSYIRPSASSGWNSLATAADKLPGDMRLFVPDPDGIDSYPIVTLSWVLLYHQYEEQKKATALKEFLNWSLYRGQEIAGQLGYIPLPYLITSRAATQVAYIF